MYTDREWRRIREKEKAEARSIRRLAAVAILLAALTAALFYAVYVYVLRSHDDTAMRLGFGTTSLSDILPGGNEEAGRASPFAANLCVTSSDVNADSLFLSATEAALFDLNNCEVEYAKNIFEERSPASLTKVMTALVAMKYGNLDDIVTVTATANDIEAGSSVCDLHIGDKLSLRQLLYGLLIASGNDAAMMIAEHVGGSVSTFVAMMNAEAQALGATHTHFMNPHGLTASGHYTTAYDMYLMFKAAMEYPVFMDIINRENYYAEFTDGDGDAYAITWETTDHYFTGEAQAPDNVIVYGGKTGTTQDAGACLILLSKDLYGNPFLSVIMNSESKDTLYTEMNQLLALV